MNCQIADDLTYNELKEFFIENRHIIVSIDCSFLVDGTTPTDKFLVAPNTTPLALFSRRSN